MTEKWGIHDEYTKTKQENVNNTGNWWEMSTKKREWINTEWMKNEERKGSNLNE